MRQLLDVRSQDPGTPAGPGSARYPRDSAQPLSLAFSVSTPSSAFGWSHFLPFPAAILKFTMEFFFPFYRFLVSWLNVLLMFAITVTQYTVSSGQFVFALSLNLF